ncbi:MAG: FAD-dependent oxidoreductase, partial [bacterium]|nr:FAD-dependent oxidoreductase [bacterium]
MRFVRTLPGGASARIAWMSPETGVRETRRVKGRVVVTGDDYLSGRCWEDAVCYATYQIDMHAHRWKDFVRVPLGRDVYPTVPYRALLPAGVEHLLVAGRCLSADRRAFAAQRLCAPAMSTGQAAGAAGA